jgi:orotate phosphoribosyltransferase
VTASITEVTTRTAAVAVQALLGDPDAVADLIARPGVIRLGHYRLLAGLHTDTFVAFSGIATDTAALDLIANWALGSIAAWQPTDVLAPSTVGVALASTIARRIGARLSLANLGPDGRPNGITSDAIRPGSRVLLVNDIITTGIGVGHLADLARSVGGHVAGVVCFASRATVNISAAINAPAIHIADLDLKAWPAANCSLCRDGQPLKDAVDLN